MTTKQLDIKNRTYYFFNDLINVSNFEPGNLKLDKKSWKDIDIYYIGYNDKNKPSEWGVDSVNPLYLIVNKVFCFVAEKIVVKYLKIDKRDVLNKWNQVFKRIKYHIRKISDEKVIYDSDFDKIRFVTDDSFPLGKLIYFPTLTVAMKCVSKQNSISYPQIYLDDAMYQL